MDKLIKFPDLETCKAISHLFDDSVSHWIKRLDTGGEFICKKGQEGWYKWEILANAPDCVELGVVRWDLHYKKLEGKTREEQWHLNKNFEREVMSCFESAGETQARAGAIKQIIEER